MTFVRAAFGDTILAAILLCIGCSSTDSPGTGGTAGQSPGSGGHSAGHGGQSGSDAGASGDAGESAGAGGAPEDSAGGGNEAGMSSGGTGPASTGGAGNSGSGGHATAGSTATGGASGTGECVWDPISTDHCPACDASSGCARPGYKYVGSGAITSSCCSFEWQEETAPGKYSWSEASAYCVSLSLLGGGWRLPKIAELYSLVDLSDESHTTPTIDVDAFADTLREAYWSSSPKGQSGQEAWSVNFSDGSSQSTASDEQHRVRCVR